MEKGLISIVLPIYNVEKYLERCILSVVNQTYEKLEIILVDDGSTDTCPAICDSWAQKDERIKVIHKRNAGLGMARNTGIENATGEYICFFDSDDYIALDAVEKAYYLQKKYHAEIVCFGFFSVNKNGKIVVDKIPNTPKNVYEGIEVQEVFLPNLISFNNRSGEDWCLNMSAWAGMFSLKVIKEHSWRFVSERKVISEDIYSLLELYKNISKVAVLSEALYYYCENENSLSRSYRRDRYVKIRHFYLESLKLWKKCGYSVEVRERLSEPFLANTIAAMKQIVFSNEQYTQKMKDLKTIINDDVLQTVILNKNISGEVLTRKILFWCIKHKLFYVCYILCGLKRQSN